MVYPPWFAPLFAILALGLAVLNSKGVPRPEEVDVSFVPPPLEGVVQVIAVQGDGKVLVAGQFAGPLGASGTHMVRLEPDGAIDGSFDARFGLLTSTNGGVTAMALEPSGRIVVGGAFTNVHGIVRRGLARLGV